MENLSKIFLYELIIEEFMHNKKIYILLTLILMIILIIKFQIDYSDQKYFTGEKCQEQAKELIPTNLTLHLSTEVEPKAYFIDDFWNDGQLIAETTSNFNSIYFIEGTQTGYNPNLHYFTVLLKKDSEVNPQDVYLKYTKNVTDDSGKKLGQTQFFIRPILRKVSANKFQIVKYNFADFNPETYSGYGCIWINN